MSDQPGVEQPGWAAPDPNVPSGYTPPPPAYGAPTYGAPPPYSPPPTYNPPPAYGGQPPGWYGYNAKPGVVALRPLGVGEILDGALSTVRSNWKVLLGATALVGGAFALLDFILQMTIVNGSSLVVNRYDGSTEADFGVLGGLIPLELFEFLALLTVTSVCAAVTSRAVLGERPNWDQTWDRVRPQLGRLLGVGLLAFLAIAAGSIACGIGAVYVWVILSLCVPVLVLERTAVTRALGRSNELVKGAWWRTFGILLLGYLLSAVINFAISIPLLVLGAAGSIFTGSVSDGQDVGLAALSALAGFLVSVIVWPYLGCLVSILYVDRRMRSEGLDLELQRAAGMTAAVGGYPPAQQYPAAPPPQYLPPQYSAPQYSAPQYPAPPPPYPPPPPSYPPPPPSYPPPAPSYQPPPPPPPPVP